MIKLITFNKTALNETSQSHLHCLRRFTEQTFYRHGEPLVVVCPRRLHLDMDLNDSFSNLFCPFCPNVSDSMMASARSFVSFVSQGI